MDISPEYMKMCEMAEEIQDQWKPNGGDWYLHDYRGSTKTTRDFEKQVWGDSDKIWENIEILCYLPSESKDVVISFSGDSSHCVSVADLVRDHCVWLPRQDQLQEIIFGTGKYGSRQIVKALWEACKDNGSLVPREGLGVPRLGTVDKKWSMEQLWLAFVMSERYQKIWDGEEWIKI